MTAVAVCHAVGIEGGRMASYLIQVSYTSQAWASLVKNPHDRTQVLKPVLEKLGGK